MNFRTTSAIALSFATAGAAMAQNDDCAGAIAASAGVATAFDTTAATTSVEPWPCALGGTDIWFTYTPTMSGGSVNLDLCGSGYDTAIEAFSGTCGSLTSIACNDDSCGLQSNMDFGPTAAGTPLYFRIGGFNGASGTGTFTLTENPPGMGQDECTGAVPLMAGVATPFDTTGATASFTQWPCAGGGGPDLWYSYTTSAAGVLVTADLCGSSYDCAVEIFSGTCAALVSETCNDDSCGLQSVASASVMAAGTTVYIRVGGFAGNTGTGTITVTEGPDPCQGAPDAFEDNDDCASAAPIGDGNYMGLSSQIFDQDLYAVSVSDGGTFTAEIFFTHANADLDLYLWDPNIACDSDVVGEGLGSGALDVGFSVSDMETVTYTNNTGSTLNLVVEVTVYNFSAGDCADYDMTITGADGNGGIGTNYCMANANSAGTTGVMSAMGSRSVANNDVTITASALPLNAFGFFICSETPGFVPNPAGSQGNLCLGGAIGRYVGPGQIMNTGGSGDFSLTLDLTQTPQPNGFVSVMAGERWHYQAWHRDSVGGMATSNFTDAIHIDYI